MRASADQASVSPPGYSVDRRHHRLDMEHATERAVGRECLQDRARIGEPAGFDHDAAKVGQFAALAFHDHAAQRPLQIGAGNAAEATVAEQHGFVGAGAHQCVVNAGCAELVDHHRSALPCRRSQEALEQSRLAGAEKAGDHGDRYARPALALESAPEASGGR